MRVCYDINSNVVAELSSVLPTRKGLSGLI
jgi:hypothetical protein